MSEMSLKEVLGDPPKAGEQRTIRVGKLELVENDGEFVVVRIHFPNHVPEMVRMMAGDSIDLVHKIDFTD